jgi:hypothetical protein
MTMVHLAFPTREVSSASPPDMIDAAPRPLVLVLEAEPRISDILAELAGFLRVDVECVPTIGALETALDTQRPIGLLAHTPEGDDTVWSALRAVARRDPGLPVLLVTGTGRAETEEFDPSIPRRPLTNIYWVDHQPGMRSIVEFLFLAERRSGAPALLREAEG